MKLLSNKKMVLVAFVLVIALTLGLMGTAFGAEVIKVIRVYANGKLLSMPEAPVMIKDRVYVPVRAMSEVLGKNVHWDGPSYSVVVTDREDAATGEKVKELEATIAQLKAQLSEKDMQYIILKAQYDALLEEGKTMSFADMEKQLNKEYDEYRNIDFDITLSGKESDIVVEIAVELDDFKSEWNKLSDSRTTTYLQNIVDTLLNEYKDADIEGYIYDSSIRSNPKLVTFTLNSKDKVQLKSSSSKLADLEDDLDYWYNDYFSGISFDIELEGDEDEIEFYVYVNMYNYDTKWNSLTNDEVRRLMEYIYDDIEDEFDDADITGYVMDSYYGDQLARYYLTSSGSVRFNRY
jgi:hypothetical protein